MISKNQSLALNAHLVTRQLCNHKLKQELKDTYELLKRMSEDKKVSPQQISQIEQKYRQVENALQRVTNETYGTCLACGGEIDTSRLHILPYSELSLSCQQKKEMQAL